MKENKGVIMDYVGAGLKLTRNRVILPMRLEPFYGTEGDQTIPDRYNLVAYDFGASGIRQFNTTGIQALKVLPLEEALLSL